MEGNDISSLRSILFETMRGIKDGTVDIDRARAINGTASVIIETAKVEVAHMKVAGGCGSGFIGDAAGQTLLADKTATGTKTVTQLSSGVQVTRHRME
jgi:hypothetical protein